MMKFLYWLFILLFLSGCRDESNPLDGFSEEQKVLVKAIKSADVDKVRELAAKMDLDLVSDKSVPLLTSAIYDPLGDLKSDILSPSLAREYEETIHHLYL